MRLLQIIITLLFVISARAEEEEDACVDLDEQCEDWASIGECVRNAQHMKELCPLSCEVCEEDNKDEGEEEEEEGHHEEEDHDGIEESDDENEENLEEEDEEQHSNNEMYDDKEQEQDEQNLPEAVFWSTAADLGLAQRIILEDATRPEDMSWIISKARNYMKEVVPNKFGPAMSKLCRNRHRQCAYWAWKGECNTNDEFMMTKCAPMCQSCHYLTPEGRCELLSHQPNTWAPGDLNKLFEKWTSEPFLSTYSVQVLSSPSNDKPWVISMDNILTEVEAKHLIELGHEMGFRRPTDIAKRRVDGTYPREVVEGRTLMNTWCTGTCAEDTIVEQVSERLSELTEIPMQNMESLQLLKYEVGQMYSSHHDFVDHHGSTPAGPRILTMFLYLNDVEEGGGTRFEELDVTVVPKRGSVLIWPNTLDQNPLEPDLRTLHEALPVAKGVKYGANAWFHVRDYQTPFDEGCMDGFAY